ncbi:proline dehydrogenase family protein [Natronococcus sp. A-GB1]|uniref:proline dehydrogenase family protein n=1 Tax=Natronococcus sp. A-GB1 TaxID=3037648 RepID=UPI00241C2786|nr:proline dehydrogenase family protein [Natronococcus sp. A-GB1]MDG5761817.1 proline dehydrogenase family protein [Natronococcus sp. A-GB1]
MLPPVARQFVAGETSAEALEHVRRLNELDINGMLNRLGTHHRDRRRVRDDARAYRLLVEDVGNTGLEGGVSVKPSQLGLDLGADVFRDSLREVLEAAAPRDVVVWLDMEAHASTDATLAAFEALAPEYGEGIGVCLQANLKRSREDLDRLADLPGKVRLVKGGAYDEPRAVAYRDRDRMDRAYRDLLEAAFERFDDGVAVATHDPAMVEHAISLHERYGTPFEIQMLMGVRPDAQVELAKEYDVWQYVPYGTRWKRYFLNRVTENGRTVRFAARALLEGVRRGDLRSVPAER